MHQDVLLKINHICSSVILRFCTNIVVIVCSLVKISAITWNIAFSPLYKVYGNFNSFMIVGVVVVVVVVIIII